MAEETEETITNYAVVKYNNVELVGVVTSFLKGWFIDFFFNPPHYTPIIRESEVRLYKDGVYYKTITSTETRVKSISWTDDYGTHEGSSWDDFKPGKGECTDLVIKLYKFEEGTGRILCGPNGRILFSGKGFSRNILCDGGHFYIEEV